MSTYSPNLRVELITTGTQAGTWGNTTNDNLSTVLEAAIAGSVSVTTAATNYALTYLNGPTSTAADNQSVRAILLLNTSTGGAYNVYAPPVSKLYTIKNSAAYAVTIYNSTVIGNTTAAGTGVTVPAGATMSVVSDGTNFTLQNTAVPLNSGVTGTLPVANGGTGVTTSTGSGNVVLSTSPTLTTPNIGTPSAGVLTNCSGTAASLTAGAAQQLTTTNFSVVQSGSKLYIKYGTTNIFSIDSSGNIIVAADVTAFGTP